MITSPVDTNQVLRPRSITARHVCSCRSPHLHGIYRDCSILSRARGDIDPVRSRTSCRYDAHMPLAPRPACAPAHSPPLSRLLTLPHGQRLPARIPRRCALPFKLPRRARSLRAREHRGRLRRLHARPASPALRGAPDPRPRGSQHAASSPDLAQRRDLQRRRGALRARNILLI
jgi:hypothetical protein